MSTVELDQAGRKSSARKLRPGRRRADELGRGASKPARAIVKISGYSRNVAHFQKHLDYITRNGELPLERSDGSVAEGKAEVQATAVLWEKHLEPGRKSTSKAGAVPRHAAHFILSFPEGVPAEKARGIARQWGEEAFGKTSPWAFSLHADTDHPHAHFVVPARGYDLGRVQRFGPAELRQLRELQVSVAAEFGVVLTVPARAKRVPAEPKKATKAAQEKELRPTAGMLDLASRIALERGVELPPAASTDFGACRSFLDANSKREIGLVRDLHRPAKGTVPEEELGR